MVVIEKQSGSVSRVVACKAARKTADILSEAGKIVLENNIFPAQKRWLRVVERRAFVCTANSTPVTQKEVIDVFFLHSRRASLEVRRMWKMHVSRSRFSVHGKERTTT